MPTTTSAQAKHWSRHAARYDDVFLDPFVPGVENPIIRSIASMPDAGSKNVIDLGCGTGPLLSLLLGRYGEVIAVDFAPKMIEEARRRLGADADRIRFYTRPMHQLDEFAEAIDVAVAINSLVMPDVRLIDRTLRAIRRAMKPGGVFFGVVPSIDAIQYQTMLLLDRALENGHPPGEAARLAARQAEHHLYEFAFGRFAYEGLNQKFWQSFEVTYRLRKAGFSDVRLDRVLYPWDSNLPCGEDFSDQPRSWDWAFEARP